MAHSGPQKFSRRAFLGAAATATSAAALPSVPAFGSRRSSSQPNVVVILTDQLSASALSCVGNGDLSTPNIDRMAAAGTLFTESYAADPVCCPARASFFTGRASSEHGVLLNPMELDASIPDVGSWLRERSDHDLYYLGKWHIPGRTVGDSFTEIMGQPLAGCSGDMALARTFEGLLTERSSTRPFVSIVSLVNPHDICLWQDQHRSSNDVDPEAIAGLVMPTLPLSFQAPNAEAALYRQLRRAGSRDNWSREKWEYFRWSYFRYVEQVDGVVGRLLDLVWNSRFGRDTVVIFTADHGEMAGEQGLTMKSYFYDASARVPMIVAWPGELPEGRVDRRHLVSGLDLTPTLCDLAGVAAPPDMRGLSLHGLLAGTTATWRDCLQVQGNVEGRMIRTEQYKYVAFRDDPVEQLFDLRADPWEMTNLAEDSDHYDVLEDHRALQEEIEAGLEHTDLSLAGYDAAKAVAVGGGA